MTDKSAFQCRDDPERFMAVVLNKDKTERYAAFTQVDDLVTCECLRHGITNDISALPDVISLFDNQFINLPLSDKRRIYSHVAYIVPQLGGDYAGAFTPFMMLDRDISIVSTATIDYTSIGSLIEDDPMARPKDALNMILRNLPRNPAAVFGGLLVLGDPRVCELLAPLRPHIDADFVAEITKCFSGFSYKCVIEFYLDWLSMLVDARDPVSEGVFGNVAAGLYRILSGRDLPFIIDGLRPFPASNRGSSTIVQINPDDFAQEIASQLYALEEREGGPKVLPHIIRAFGLAPRTPIENTALMH
jgi:hypothetical protein